MAFVLSMSVFRFKSRHLKKRKQTYFRRKSETKARSESERNKCCAVIHPFNLSLASSEVLRVGFSKECKYQRGETKKMLCGHRWFCSVSFSMT